MTGSDRQRQDTSFIHISVLFCLLLNVKFAYDLLYFTEYFLIIVNTTIVIFLCQINVDARNNFCGKEEKNLMDALATRSNGKYFMDL